MLGRKKLGFDIIISQNARMRETIDLAKKVAAADAVVLITGESGTGKDLVASAMHQTSPRADQPFVAINCAAVPDTLLESELFGHEKGAFTGATAVRKGKFEQANGGTLFLDEIGDMSLTAQAKILRAIGEHTLVRVGGQKPIPIDVRIITATNQPLMEHVRLGRFRQDLYYRLNEVHISLPPLRERKDDIPLLIEHFIEVFNKQYNRRVKGISAAALEFLMRHDWPGNVRELENLIKVAMLVMEDSDVIWIEHIPLDIHLSESGREEEEKIVTKADSLLEILSLEEMEKRHIMRILELTGWNKSQTANILKISRPTLDRKISRYNLEDMRRLPKLVTPTENKENVSSA